MPLMARLLVVASLTVSAVVVFAAPAVADGAQAPVVTQVVPVQGSTVGYTDVVINGRGFTGVSSVVVGGIDATRVHVLSTHRLAAYFPPHGHGAKNVVVHTSHGTSKLSRATTFNYVHATLPGSWTSTRVAPPADAGTYDDMRLTDTSCPTVSTCYSGGGVTYDYVGNDPQPPSTGEGPVIRTRTGSSSSLVYAPLPADTDQNGLYRSEVDAIDCPAVGSCAAVGSYPATDTSSPSRYESRVLLLTLSDGTWRSQAAPASAAQATTSTSSDVSCGAPGECLVSARGELYRLSGDTWTAVRPVVPSGAKSSGVEHVSCPSATYCAVGLAGSPNTYLDVLDNNRLTSVAVHAPAGVEQANYRPEILALRCAAAQQCVAVIGNDHGKYYNTDFLRLAGAGLNGQAHHLIPPPEDIYSAGQAIGYRGATGLNASQVFALTLVCPSTTTCFATNHYYATAGKNAEGHSVVARLAASTVHVFVLPETTGTGSARTVVTNLSCPSVSSCVAVGARVSLGRPSDSAYDNDYPSAPYDTFANGVWTPGSLPTVANQPSASQGQFPDLDCAAVGHCFADAAYAFDIGSNSDGSPFVRSQDLDAVLAPN